MNSYRNFFGPATIAQSKLVLHEAIFLANCLPMLEKNHCKLQKTCYMLQSLQKVGPSSTSLNCCKPEKIARQVAKRACYTLQPTCNFCRNAIGAQVANRIASCNISCRARFYSLQRLQRFFKQLRVAAPDCNI